MRSECYDFWDTADAPRLRSAGKMLRDKLEELERENAMLREENARIQSKLLDIESKLNADLSIIEAELYLLRVEPGAALGEYFVEWYLQSK